MFTADARRIKADLPSFPEEVVEDWLAPLVGYAGWPPTPLSPWNAILLGRPLSFWRALSWEKTRVTLNRWSLDPRSLAQIEGIIDAGAYGASNAYSQQIRDSRARFKNALRYVRERGHLPRPPVLLHSGIQYTVADGNHRLAAYFFVGASPLGPTCWVGRSPPRMAGNQ
jgi:hypothetical protein